MSVFDFWFGEIKDGWTVENRSALWFGGRAEDDKEIIRRFGVSVKEALAEEHKGEHKTPTAALTDIILLDQMTRVVYRGMPQAFAGDVKALAFCKASIAQGMDKELPVVCRNFFYMPLEHSENLADQENCVDLFARLRDALPVRGKELDYAYDYAVKHRDIIAQFGRFPHRNAILGRASTAEEETYLATNAERFGQLS